MVAGTDTEIGKTVLAALLVRAAARSGRETRYWKPVQTGEDSDTARIVELAGLPPAATATPAVELPLPASVDQAAAAAGRCVSVAEVLDAARCRFGNEPAATWIVECAGGLRVPYNEREDQADFLAKLAAPLVLAARSGLGTLNHTLLTLEAAARRGLEVRALFLIGPQHPGNVATLRGRLPSLPLFEVPRFGALSPGGLDAWLDVNDLAEILP